MEMGNLCFHAVAIAAENLFSFQFVLTLARWCLVLKIDLKPFLKLVSTLSLFFCCRH